MSAANTFGHLFKLTTFGESHGPAIGAVIDGCPAGVAWDEDLLIRELDRRRPGTSAFVSGRAELDRPEVLSGIYQGKTLGSPIAIVVRNSDARSKDYEQVIENPRAGHADDVWRAKFGHADPRGGGRSSGRETLSRVMGGAIAKMFLKSAAPQLRIFAFARSIGPLEISSAEIQTLIQSRSAYPADEYIGRLPSPQNQDRLASLLTEAKENGQSYGGVAELHAYGVPVGLGQPVFQKLKSELAASVMGIGAASAFEFGSGFAAKKSEGTEFHREPESENYGGIRGGISTGEPIVMRVVFKPTSSVLDVAKKGRHDPCIVPRAIPVIEAMVALVLADQLLLARSDRT